MRIDHLDRVFTLVCLGLGLFIVYSAWTYGLYANGVPGPGFFPLIAGIMMTLLAAGILLRDLGNRGRLSGAIAMPVMGAIAGVTLAIVAVALLSETLGMALVSLVAMIAIGLLTEEDGKRGKGFALRLVATAFGTVIACHLLFGKVIGIPLIEGPLGF